MNDVDTKLLTLQVRALVMNDVDTTLLTFQMRFGDVDIKY
jgi:hypothetical protein